MVLASAEMNVVSSIQQLNKFLCTARCPLLKGSNSQVGQSFADVPSGWIPSGIQLEAKLGDGECAAMSLLKFQLIQSWACRLLIRNIDRNSECEMITGNERALKWTKVEWSFAAFWTVKSGSVRFKSRVIRQMTSLERLSLGCPVQNRTQHYETLSNKGIVIFIIAIHQINLAALHLTRTKAKQVRAHYYSSLIVIAWSLL